MEAACGMATLMGLGDGPPVLTGRAYLDPIGALNAAAPAAPVYNASDVARDQTLLRSGFIRALDHPEAGRHAYPSLSYQLDRRPGGITRAAPCFGHHNEQILVGLLGLSADCVAALQATGAVTDRPAAAVQAPRPAGDSKVARTSWSAAEGNAVTPGQAATFSSHPSSRQQPLAERGAR